MPIKRKSEGTYQTTMATDFLALYQLEEMQAAEDADETSEPEKPDVADITFDQ